ncbi:MAG TPA: methylenetetrahydromethanopterin dehydrogenase, partial [Burkholderiaceae bacterium]|nr:methylenetetrahydromethanopterin dehydrogenase [Burkholderiaceae bacterium]
LADPSGAYTTAAAMVARVESALLRMQPQGLAQQRVLVLGGTGPVGRIAGVLAARCGAEVSLASRGGLDVAEQAARATGQRFGITLHGAAGGEPAALRSALAAADVVLACAAAGVQVVSTEDLAGAKRLKVAADLNAVPPEGIAGLGVMDDGKPLPGTQAVGIGALAIGNVKYQTQQRLLVQMREAEKALTLGFAEAFATAQTFVAEAAGAKP